jgi:hypothetical protein
MPPEVIAFFNATGRFPQSNFDLQAFNAQGAPVSSPLVPQAQNLNPGGSPIVTQDPFTRPGFFGPQIAGPQPLQSQVEFNQAAPLVQQPPGVNPTALGGPNPLQNPVQQISSPQLTPLRQSTVPSEQVRTPDLPEQISRARLGSRAGGPVAAGGAVSFGPQGFQGLGGVGIGAGGGAGQGLISAGLQQQADVANQQRVAASALSALLGGGLGGGLGAIG